MLQVEDETNDVLADIPIVVLTSSKVKTDEERAHDLGANAYLVKPLALDDARRLFTETDQFLLGVRFEYNCVGA